MAETATDSGPSGATNTLLHISERLAELTPEQIAAPPMSAYDPDESLTVYGEATENMKRLLTLSDLFVAEYNALIPEFREVEQRIGRPQGLQRYALAFFREDLDGNGSPEDVARLKELRKQLKLKHLLQDVVTHLFWIEVAEAFPESLNKNSTLVLTDWSIAGRNEVLPVIQLMLGTDDIEEELPDRSTLN